MYFVSSGTLNLNSNSQLPNPVISERHQLSANSRTWDLTPGGSARRPECTAWPLFG